MMKKIFYGILISCALMLIPSGVLAANTVKVGTTEYETFAEALTNVEEGGTITLIDDVSLIAASTIINKDITIDLNGFDMSAVNKVLTIQGANVVITGEGSIIETTPDYAPIYVKGSNDATDENYTVVTIGKDVTLVGWSGIFVTPYESSGSPYAYGVVINFNGTINAVNDSAGSHAYGIYVNGQIQQPTKPVKVNINNGAVITSTGTGFFAAGYADWKVDGANITGVDSGIAVKAGKININNSTIKATGPAAFPEVNNNGVNPSGAGIQIESNAVYAGGIVIDVKNSNIISEKLTAVYEYGNKATTNLTSFSTEGGSYISNNHAFSFFAFKLSSKVDPATFTVKNGTYSGDPSRFVADGYRSVYDYTKGVFVVTKTTIAAGDYDISGTVTGAVNATLQLKQGGTTIAKGTLDVNGDYSFTNVKPGIYNIVASYYNQLNDPVDSIKTVEVKDRDVTFDFALTSYVSKLMLLGLNTPDIVVNGLDEVTATDNVFLEVTLIDTLMEEDEEKVAAIKELAKKENIVLFNFSLYIEGFLARESDLNYNPIEIIVPYDLAKNKNAVIYRYHNDEAEAFTKLSARPVTDYEDGTYYLDTTKNLIYIYTKGFSIYAIGADTVPNPDTSDNILLYVGLGIAGLITTAVILKKKRIFN